MRDQFAGDISDLLKFSLLRSLAGEDKSLGVGWYFVPEHNGRPDGMHREFCHEPNWKSLDENVWEGLRNLKQRSVEELEKLQFWRGEPKFHREPVPGIVLRQAWFSRLKDRLNGCSLVFLDPDNGLGKGGKLHATTEEIRGIRQERRAVVLISFPGRVQHDEQAELLHHRLTSDAGARVLMTIATAVMVGGKPRVRWFTIIDPDEALAARAKSFVEKLNSILACKAHFVPRASKRDLGPIRDQVRQMEARENQERICPECGYQFRGRGFVGIDAHWKAKHESLMPYSQAWPLIQAGKYRRDGFVS